MADAIITTYRYRVKDKHARELNRMAQSANVVWNYCNNAQKHALEWGKKWPTKFDLHNMTAGSSKALGLHSGTIQAVCEQYAKSRSQKKRPYLRYRGKKSLSWVPVKGCYIRRNGINFKFSNIDFCVFYSRCLPDGKIRDGSGFSCDARGNWFLNIVIEIEGAEKRIHEKGVGIDLGLKDFAVLSTGEKIKNPRHLSQLANKLAVSQRAHKKQQSAKINARIANARKDFQHKLSTRIVKEFDFIAVGNVNAAGLAKTRMAKSVLDAGWSSFRNMLRYKAIGRGAEFEEVEEKFTTQTCSSCGSRSSSSRLKGIAGLRIRMWICDDCGCEHDRDINASRNILSNSRYGHVSLDVGIPAL